MTPDPDADGGQDTGEENQSSDDDAVDDPATEQEPGDSIPQISVTIEGRYREVVGRLDHPRSAKDATTDAIGDNLERTLLAVGAIGGGIRSEVYEAAEFDLEDPWEIRKYLEVLAMHGLIRLEDDRWVPARSPASPPPDDHSE